MGVLVSLHVDICYIRFSWPRYRNVCICVQGCSVSLLHAYVQGCLAAHLEFLLTQKRRQRQFKGDNFSTPDIGEFACPVCGRLCNSQFAVPDLCRADAVPSSDLFTMYRDGYKATCHPSLSIGHPLLPHAQPLLPTLSESGSHDLPTTASDMSVTLSGASCGLPPGKAASTPSYSDLTMHVSSVCWCASTELGGVQSSEYYAGCSSLLTWLYCCMPPEDFEQRVAKDICFTPPLPPSDAGDTHLVPLSDVLFAEDPEDVPEPLLAYYINCSAAMQKCVFAPCPCRH